MPLATVEGVQDCGAPTASGTWSLPYGSPTPLRVAVLSPAGEGLGAGPVADDGSWTLPLRPGVPASVVLLQDGAGPVATGLLGGC